MLTESYKEALVELLEILKYANKDEISRIPKKLMNFFKKNASSTYKFTIDEKTGIKDLKIKKETKGLLTMLYRNYWCNINERKEYDISLARNQKLFEADLREKYNPDKIFEKSNAYSEDNSTSTSLSNNINKNFDEEIPEEIEKQLISYKENFFYQILEKIRNFFQKFVPNN